MSNKIQINCNTNRFFKHMINQNWRALKERHDDLNELKKNLELLQIRLNQLIYDLYFIVTTPLMKELEQTKININLVEKDIEIIKEIIKSKLEEIRYYSKKLIIC